MGGARVEAKAIRFVRFGLARRLGWAALACLVLPSPVFGLLAQVGEALGAPGLGRALVALWSQVLLGALLLGLAALAARVTLRGQPGALEVSGDALVVERRRARRIPLASVTEGWTSPRTGEVVLALRSGDRLLAEVEPDAGRRLLEAAGLDASRRTVRMKLGETLFLDLLSLLLGPIPVTWVLVALDMGTRRQLPVLLQRNLVYIAFIALMAGVFAAMRTLFGPAELVIGADGLIVRRFLRDRFVRWADLVSTDVRANGVVLTLANGRALRAKARHLGPDARAQLSGRIDEALAVWRRGGDDAEPAARLGRRGRSLTAWRQEVARALAADARYREAPVPRDAVVRVLESAAAPVGRRLGAALALADASSDERERVRAVARGTAEPRLRVALESIAAGTPDEAAIEALTAAEEAVEGRARRA